MSLIVRPDEPANSDRVSILAVLVLYRCDLAASKTWQTLHPQIESTGGLCTFELLVCENEAKSASEQPVPQWVKIERRAVNAGLAWAYQLGLQRARETGAAWLLTLDQDTGLPDNFLIRLIEQATGLWQQEEIAAIVPQLVSRTGRVYSPVVAKVGREHAVRSGYCGVGAGDIRAFNSAALLRVRWLELIGGFNQFFWLDYLDHATFRAFFKAGGRVWIAGDIQVEHHLSLEDGRSSMSKERFANFLQAESAFVDFYGSVAEGWLYTMRLAARLWNQRRRGDPSHFPQQTRALLWSRLRLSRKARLAAWMESVQQR